MRLWLDAQLPPAVARWLADEIGLDAVALRDLGLRFLDSLQQRGGKSPVGKTRW